MEDTKMAENGQTGNLEIVTTKVVTRRGETLQQAHERDAPPMNVELLVEKFPEGGAVNGYRLRRGSDVTPLLLGGMGMARCLYDAINSPQGVTYIIENYEGRDEIPAEEVGELINGLREQQ